jgi:hypothetical protein
VKCSYKITNLFTVKIKDTHDKIIRNSLNELIKEAIFLIIKVLRTSFMIEVLIVKIIRNEGL